MCQKVPKSVERYSNKCTFRIFSAPVKVISYYCLEYMIGSVKVNTCSYPVSFNIRSALTFGLIIKTMTNYACVIPDYISFQSTYIKIIILLQYKTWAISLDFSANQDSYNNSLIHYKEIHLIRFREWEYARDLIIKKINLFSALKYATHWVIRIKNTRKKNFKHIKSQSNLTVFDTYFH